MKVLNIIKLRGIGKEDEVLRTVVCLGEVETVSTFVNLFVVCMSLLHYL